MWVSSRPATQGPKYHGTRPRRIASHAPANSSGNHTKVHDSATAERWSTSVKR